MEEEEAGRCVVIEGLLAYTALPYVVFLVTYWGLSAFFLLCDRLLLRASTPPTRPSPSPTAAGEVTPLDRFKVQKGLTEERLRFTWSHALHVLGLHLFVSIPVGLALSPLWPDEGYVLCLPPTLANAMHAFGAASATHSTLFPQLTLFRFAYEFLFILILFEIFFFYSHFALHQPALYKRIHKLHHYYTAPVGPAAQYVHWIEHIVGNSLSPILPAIIVRAHPITYTVWAFLATCTVVASHSGYGRYALITSQEHDMHHKHFNVNFGTLGFLDQLHGTTYAQSPHYLRDQEKKLMRTAANDVRPPSMKANK